MASFALIELPVDYPHNNQGLFSNHYLDELLKKDKRAWNSFLEQELKTIYVGIKEIVEDFGIEQLQSMDEASLEQHFIRPVLRLLGWEGCLDVQISQKIIGQYRAKPDYAFFTDHETLKEAMPHLERNSQKYLDIACAVGDAKNNNADH